MRHCFPKEESREAFLRTQFSELITFTGIDKLRFRHPVIPGDQLVMRADIEKIKGRMGKVKAQCHVGDTLCAEGEYLFALMPGQNAKK